MNDENVGNLDELKSSISTTSIVRETLTPIKFSNIKSKYELITVPIQVHLIQEWSSTG